MIIGEHAREIIGTWRLGFLANADEVGQAKTKCDAFIAIENCECRELSAPTYQMGMGKADLSAQWMLGIRRMDA